MIGTRYSVIWQIPKCDLEKIVRNSNTLSDVLKHFNLKHTEGGNYNTLKQRLKEDNINYSHIKLGLDSNKHSFKPKIPLEEILIENSTYNRNALKNRLIKQQIIDNKCSICKLKPEWQGKILVLVIDHINGIYNDHRIENLRLLCPNCHSQTDTFTGRKLRKKYFCKKCYSKITKYSKSGLCASCSKDPLLKRKVEWPSVAELQEHINNKVPWTVLGRKYGVSDNSVRKWARKYKIIP